MAMHPVVFTVSLIGYVCAAGCSLAYLIQREEVVYRFASVFTFAGWVFHAIALLLLAFEMGRPPLGTLAEAMSVSLWVVVLLEMWVERQYGLKVLGAFVLPLVLLFAVPAGMRSHHLSQIAPTLKSAWLWVHISLNLVGIAAFVLNFAGALMYLLQERQLKSKRPGTFYYRLPSLETLDRLTYRTLTLGFPFLTTGIVLGLVWSESAWGFAFDPLASLSVVVWAIYAATLAGRAVVGWHGRRAAYFAIVGFVVLVVTLGAGLFLPGKHGS